MINKNKEVTNFLDELNHPLRLEIELLRDCILEANKDLTENIKWNGPNYSINTEDRFTMRIQPLATKQIQLILHRGAKKQEQPISKLIDDKSGILQWKENDRAIASFKNIEDIKRRKKDMTKIVLDWIQASE